MGLGLQGHLKALAKTDLYSYLCLDHEATQIGIMLGMAASKRATMEQVLFKHRKHRSVQLEESDGGKGLAAFKV